MAELRELFVRSEPLLLFTVIGLGHLLGILKFKNFSLGVAGVLFVGLLFGGWHGADAAPLTIAPQISQVGLILFVYAVGLTSGPGFIGALRQRGMRYNIAVAAALIAGAVFTVLAARLLGIDMVQAAGVFCGGLTNTPALAALTERASAIGLGNPSDAAVGYSMAYPFGVLGGLLGLEVFVRLFRRKFDAERSAASTRQQAVQLAAANFEITNPEVSGRAIGELRVQENSGVIISRVKHAGAVRIPTKYTVLHAGDVVVAVGTAEALASAEAYFGARSDQRLEQIGGDIVLLRILMSRRALAGKTVEQLELDRRFNAQVTRIRRADVDFSPAPDTRLLLGDRLAVVLPRERGKQVTAFFGDSERDIAELDYTALTLGICLGVLLGMIPFPIPGGSTLSLGFAGGPLVVGIILGYLGRSGPLIWSVPIEVNHVLRHIGLLLFLAAVGVMAGARFFDAFGSGGPQLIALGAGVTVLTTAITMWLLYALGAPVVTVLGATTGMQTQPATLAKARDITQSDETFVAYAITYPVAMVGKILLAQLMLLFA